MTSPRLRRTLILFVLTGLVSGVPGCAKRKEKHAEDGAFLSAEALYRRGVEQLAHDNLAKAREDLERITFAVDTLKLLEPLVKLRLADATFYRGDDISYIDARAKYLDFIVLDGGHPLAPYAQFQAGICSLQQVSAPTQDQSQTLTALEDFREVIHRWPGTDYAQAAAGVIREAETFLARHDYAVGQFYYSKKKFRAAASRFRDILDHYPGYPDKDRVYLRLGQALMRGGKATEGKSYLDRVVENYPGTDAASKARRFLAKYEALEKRREASQKRNEALQKRKEHREKRKEDRKKGESSAEPPTQPDPDTDPPPSGSDAPPQNNADGS